MEATMETTDPRMRMFSDQQIAKMEGMSKDIQKNLSPRGALGLPEHLDRRRLEHGITDGAFRVQAAYDRILVHQIPMAHFMAGTFGEGGLIVMPKDAESARERSAPRGIVVSAGLKALDEMRSNGIELGDIVMFNHVSPWRIETDMIGGKLHHVLVMHAGHIIGSEDLATRLRKRELFLDGPVTEHVYVNRGTGDRPTPVLPAMMTSEEY
jgi:hypothetical protein